MNHRGKTNKSRKVPRIFKDEDLTDPTYIYCKRDEAWYSGFRKIDCNRLWSFPTTYARMYMELSTTRRYSQRFLFLSEHNPGGFVRLLYKSIAFETRIYIHCQVLL